MKASSGQHGDLKKHLDSVGEMTLELDQLIEEMGQQTTVPWPFLFLGQKMGLLWVLVFGCCWVVSPYLASLFFLFNSVVGSSSFVLEFECCGVKHGKIR